jgi:hypothetical protein
MAVPRSAQGNADDERGGGKLMVRRGRSAGRAGAGSG